MSVVLPVILFVPNVLIDNNVLDVKLYNSVVTGPNTWSPHTFRRYITLASLSTELQVSSK